jgi:ABC-2 type transport system permease protein
MTDVPSAKLNSRQVVGLILRREVATRVRTRAYKITTAIMVVAVIALPVGIKLFGTPSSARTVGLTPSTAALASPLVGAARAIGQEVKIRTVPDVPTGERELTSGNIDALVVAAAGDIEVVAHKGLDDRLRQSLTVLAQQQALNAAIVRAGGDPAVVGAAVAGAKVDVRSLQPESRYQGERIALGMLAGILVYLSLIIYGQMVAQGVVEEKTSRVVELLLATVRPWQLMLGKIVGIGTVGLGQLVAVTVAALATALGTGVLHVPSSIAVGAVGWTLLWYLLGFLLYALLFGAAGALVSRQEDVGAVVGPITILIIIPYIVGVSVLPADPENSLARVLSLIPLFTPMLMPMRIALGVAPWWEVALTVVLTAALIAALVGLCARIYRNSVMRTGARVPVRDALRSA